MNSWDGERQGERASAQARVRMQITIGNRMASFFTHRLISVIVWTICVLLLAAAEPLVAQEDTSQAEGTVAWIFQNMAQVYADCTSYSDSGLVKTVFFQADGERTTERPFTTAFVRPGRFRFEYTEQLEDGRESRYIVWQSEPLVQIWWSIESDEFLDALDSSLALALAGGTGISGGSAHTIPTLLLPSEILGTRLMDMTEAERIEDAYLDKTGCEVTAASVSGDECYRVQGQFATSSVTEMIVWIEKKTFLVRRIDKQNQFETFRTESTTTYSPAINGDISEDMLEFGVPEQE